MPRFLRFLALFCGIVFPAALPSQTQQRPKKPVRQAPANDAARKAQDANEELERAVESAGNDRRALVRNLRSYLDRYPDSPRREHVFRAIVEASLQLGDPATALEYAERLIALRPEDPSMMLLAVDLLERVGDEASNTRAAGYITRVIDRIEKATDEDRPASLTPQEWLDEQKKLLMSLYLIRGRLEMRRHRYDEAAADLEKSYALLPNPGAAVRLGEIAEIRGQYERAIASYLTAFTLPEDYGVAVDRRQLRQKLGNVWRLVHGSEEGLGAKILESHDQHWAKPANAPTEQRNAQAKELGTFVVRRLTGEDLRLEALKDKVTVLNFWATWCLPCQEVERLFGRVAGTYHDNATVAFLSVNCDDNEALARAFAENQKLGGQIVFEDGLRRLFAVSVMPTVIVLDRSGQIAYRGEGFSAANLQKEVSAAIESALGRLAREESGASYRVVNLMPLFWDYWQKAESMDIAGKKLLFLEMVARPHPELYTYNVLGLDNSKPLEEELDRKLQRFFDRIPPHIPTMRRLSASIEADLPRHIESFRQHFPDFRYTGTFYFLPSLGSFDGAGRAVAGVPSMLFGVDDIARVHGPDADLGAFFDHELFHIYEPRREQPLPVAEGSHPLFLGLWEEGLATYVSRVLNPQAPQKEIFGLPEDMPQRAQAILPRLAKEIREKLDSESRDDYRDFFLGNTPRKDIPPRSGYYVAYLVVEKLAAARSLQQVAQLGGPALRKQIEQALLELEAGR